MRDDGTVVPKHAAEWGNKEGCIYSEILYGSRSSVVWICTIQEIMYVNWKLNRKILVLFPVTFSMYIQTFQWKQDPRISKNFPKNFFVGSSFFAFCTRLLTAQIQQFKMHAIMITKQRILKYVECSGCFLITGTSPSFGHRKWGIPGEIFMSGTIVTAISGHYFTDLKHKCPFFVTHMTRCLINVAVYSNFIFE